MRNGSPRPAHSTHSTTTGFLLRWTIARKVGGLAAMLVLLLLVVAAFSYQALTNVGTELDQVVKADLPIARLIAELNTRQLEQHIALERLLARIAPRDAGREAAIEAEFERLSRQFDEDVSKTSQAVTEAARLSPAYQRIGEEIRVLHKAHQDFVASSRQAISLLAEGKTADAVRLAGLAETGAGEVDRQALSMLAEIENFTAESAAAAEAHEVSARNVSTGLALAGSLAAVIVSFIFVGGLKKSVTGVTGMAVDISDGNLRSSSLDVRTTDELGQLADIFNGMLVSLRDNVAQTHAAAASLNSAVAQIVASAQEQAAGATEQAAAVQETTATMEEINQSGNQIAERSRQVAASAEATSTATNQGLEAAQSGTKIMEAIQEQTETVAENIVSLSEKTQAVGDIIATVTDIAERSNLLALNAAIEAAAAGDHGRRFAVVANEIKSLADQAKDATGKVRGILGDIQKGINTSVMLTEEVVKRVDTGKRQTDVVERTIRHMADSLTSSIQAFQQITAATGQQQIGVDQVTQALKNIRQASSQTAVSTSQLEQAATNLTVLGQQLSKSVERYRT